MSAGEANQGGLSPLTGEVWRETLLRLDSEDHVPDGVLRKLAALSSESLTNPELLANILRTRTPPSGP